MRHQLGLPGTARPGVDAQRHVHRPGGRVHEQGVHTHQVPHPHRPDEPHAAGGYRAVILLDGDRMLLAEQLRHPERDLGDPYGRLTAREREVFHLIAEGLTTKEIARHLGISAPSLDDIFSGLVASGEK